MHKVLRQVFTILALRPAPGLVRDPWFAVCLFGGTALAVLTGYLAPPAMPLRAPAALLSVLLFQPLIEELLFRGVVQGELLAHRWGERRWMGISLANVVTTIAFASIHLVNHGLFWAAGVVLPSLLFGIVRERSNSIFPALILHCLFNAGYFGAAALA